MLFNLAYRWLRAARRCRRTGFRRCPTSWRFFRRRSNDVFCATRRDAKTGQKPDFDGRRMAPTTLTTTTTSNANSQHLDFFQPLLNKGTSTRLLVTSRPRLKILNFTTIGTFYSFLDPKKFFFPNSSFFLQGPSVSCFGSIWSRR